MRILSKGTNKGQLILKLTFKKILFLAWGLVLLLLWKKSGVSGGNENSSLKLQSVYVVWNNFRHIWKSTSHT